MMNKIILGDCTLYHGDCLEVMKDFSDNSVDAVITDPPYGLGFMGKGWDTFNPKFIDESMKKDKRPHKVIASQRRSNTAGTYDHSRNNEYQSWCLVWAIECYRVLKPGGHILSSGGTRTFHRMACAIEDAGFQIRDQIQWIYGSGFPKSYNIGKNTDGWDGWGTALKPANEPICLARKPLSEKTIVENVLKWGTGGINVGGCRVEGEPIEIGLSKAHLGNNYGRGSGGRGTDETYINTQGRFPANLILDEEAGRMLDAQSGVSVSNRNKRGNLVDIRRGNYGRANGKIINNSDYLRGHNDKGGASRFFYCAKSSRKERNAGLEGMDGIRKNHHPTVKPISLMRYLCRLITPPNGKVLDPFAGSGTTGCACIMEGFDFIGIEQNDEYIEIAVKRIKDAQQQMRLPL